MLLQIHRSSTQKILSWSPSALFPHFMKNSQLLLRPSEGPYENYFEEVRRHHVVFSEYTLQNFLLLQSNSLNKISKRKSQPFWLFSETGTSYDQLQMQQPPWFPIHFPKSKFDGLFLSKILYKRSWVQIYLFFPHLSCVLTFESQYISLLQKLLPVDTIRVAPIRGWTLAFTCPAQLSHQWSLDIPFRTILIMKLLCCALGLPS